MMAGHGGGNMVGQTASQGQFLAQTQFPPGAAVAATGSMNVTVGPGMGQPPAQAAVTQVRRKERRMASSCRPPPCPVMLPPFWSCYRVALIAASCWGTTSINHTLH